MFDRREFLKSVGLFTGATIIFPKELVSSPVSIGTVSQVNKGHYGILNIGINTYLNVGVNTQAFEIGSLSVYENIESKI